MQLKTFNLPPPTGCHAGNPSDGYGGKVLSVSLANFYAEVELRPSDTLHFLPNSKGDPDSFVDLKAFKRHIDGHGYYGGIRILKVCVIVFVQRSA
jgi:glucuronokinase